jgi:hypothetical protein
MNTHIDELVRRSLGDFILHIRDIGWQGRENEAVNLYTFGFLLRSQSDSSGALGPTQVGIEVAVAVVPANGKKSQVRKDLVIWPEPGMNPWYPAGAGLNTPLAILEWKVVRAGSRRASLGYDLRWLKSNSKKLGRPDFVGYSVSLDLRPAQAQISVIRVAQGNEESLVIP